MLKMGSPDPRNLDLHLEAVSCRTSRATGCMHVVLHTVLGMMFIYSYSLRMFEKEVIIFRIIYSSKWIKMMIISLLRALLLQQDVHCCLFLDENDKSIEVFITVKYKTHNYLKYFHLNSFCCVTQNSMSNFVVVDNITLMTQLGTLFFIL